MIARVIVDIPVMQTNKPFDYEIPAALESILEPGMRVVVPFGNRKLQGMVVGKLETSEFNQLKEIEELVDDAPVLTEELLECGRWLAESTLCFVITAFQAMLPSVMKATYNKEIILENAPLLKQEAPELWKLFESQNSWDFQTFIKLHPEAFKMVPRLIKQGILNIHHIVDDRTTHKTIKMIERAKSAAEIKIELEKLDARAVKQKEVLDFFLRREKPISQNELLEEISVKRSTLKSLLDKGLLIETEREVFRDPYQNRNFQTTAPMALTHEQQAVIQPILSDIKSKIHRVFLLHGVTGSGKTEIYLQTIDAVRIEGKQAIVLVPEIALTPMMVGRFKSRFGANVAVLHSGLSQGEKYDEWRKIHRGEVDVVVGARSAIFAPFTNLGVIIIDEEHETSYKQEESPRYHAKDVAIYRGQYHHCPVILGSATPSLDSYARAQKGVYTFAPLKHRVNQRPLPPVSMIDMREELRQGNRSMFSRLLMEKLEDRLAKGEQSVLFLNRRGFSTFVMCRDCGYVIRCPHCDISLTYHRKQNRLKCHYCGHQEAVPYQCPECQSDHIRFFGSGTQKVEAALGQLLPDARVIRMDIDTTSKKGSHEKLLKAFESGQADILLGTQMIAKGLDFPKVTFVGVLAADTMLHLPDFRASEKTFQLLTQVSGRAGRHELPGEVVIQSYTPDHYAITLAAEHDYERFYLMEMQERKRHQYPPFYYLTLVTVSHKEITKVVDVAEKITQYVRRHLTPTSIVLGPVASSIPRIKDRYRYQCMIKYKNESRLEATLQEILEHYQSEFTKDGLQIAIDMNPYVLM